MRVLKRTLAKIKSSAFTAMKKSLVALGNALVVSGGVVLAAGLVGVESDTTGAFSLMLLGFVMIWLTELLNKQKQSKSELD